MKVIKIYGVSDCPSCLQAQAVVMTHYPTVEYVYINMDFSKVFRDSIKEKYSYYYYPIIVLQQENNELLLGGTPQLQEYLEE
jgi:glutaredoxin